MKKVMKGVMILLCGLLLSEARGVMAAETVPIIDLHFHAEEGWDLQALVKVMDKVGVAKAGNGAKGPDSLVLSFAEKYPDRFIPFAGQGPFSHFIQNDGEQAWKMESRAVGEYLEQLEAGLRAGKFKGFGELFVNNTSSHPPRLPASRYPADSLLMQRLWALSATYGVPLSVHMEATEESVAEMERLLASNRQGTWIWAHTGHFAEPPLLRRLLQSHPNLYCELSWRESHRKAQFPRTSKARGVPRSIAVPIDNNGRLRKEWKALFEEFPERFLIGTDGDDTSPRSYADLISFWREILSQLSHGTATKIAYQNAERLLKLSPSPTPKSP